MANNTFLTASHIRYLLALKKTKRGIGHQKRCGCQNTGTVQGERA